MESHLLSESKNRLLFANKICGHEPVIPKSLLLDSSITSNHNDLLMTSSILSMTSSLTSPVDSGVQLLDSESDITSVMSMSGIGCDLDCSSSFEVPSCTNNKIEDSQIIHIIEVAPPSKENLMVQPQHVMTKSDIANQNTTLPCEYNVYSTSAPNLDYKITFEKEETDEGKPDRNSKIDLELTTNVDIKPDLDQLPTSQTENVMHVSVSEEVNESLKVVQTPTEPEAVQPADEQIVFRRQRKKKSDTPKKRVSFHEDILNSTKIDDIHINHGFITHQPDISMSFFNWDSIRKPDVVKGRYSWAAEGDTPYYERSIPEREVKSELYMNSRYSSTSSSSTGSVDSSSSNSLCDNETSTSDGISHTPTQKMPRSSCLKKRTKHIDTQIVQEDIGISTKHRKSESNLLDSNIFGSLKNILSFSSSVPLAERGVPEGQEDVEVYSCSSAQNNSSTPKRRSFSLSNENMNRSFDKPIETIPEIPKKVGNLNLELSRPRNNLKFVQSEGFHPNYPNITVPSNVVLCDSNVYEHTGISYSYEYDKFQKSLEKNKTPKPKSSTVYQMLLQDLNFFKKKEKEKSENDLKALCEAQPIITSPPSEVTTQTHSNSSRGKSTRSSITDWSSDTETISDLSENASRHLSSPKHKIHKVNHYSVQSLKISELDSKSDILKPAASKTSLINRFLRNVTMKKIMDAKLQKKQKTRTNKCMGLYLKGVKPDIQVCQDLDNELVEEIHVIKKIKVADIDDKLGSTTIVKLKREVFRSTHEKLINYYKVRSSYSSNGESKPLLIFLTNATLYISGFKPNQSLFNQFVLPYTELDTILIGPNGHTIHFSNSDREMQFIVSTGSTDITGNLIGQLEMIIRRNKVNPVLPAIRYLTMREMVQLKTAVCNETTVDKGEEYFHYSLVNVQDASLEPDCTPLGPTKKGSLMFKTSNDLRWETGYFILKGGVLYILSSPSNRLPLRAIPLSNGGCTGAHRTPYCLRPHTFELLLGTMVLQLAAPDEYVASEWLQVLVQSASGLYNNEANYTQACTLLLSNQHILTMREKFPNGNHLTTTDFKAQALSCANISDLTAFRIPLAEQSWCILEFACREVHETSGDLIIYFATNSELERFISTLEMLWIYNNLKGESFPLSTIPDKETISKRCEDAYKTLQSAWASINLVLQ